MIVTRRHIVVALSLLAAFAFTLVLAEGASTEDAHISIGVEQVARGSAVYARNCAECHGEALEGFGPFPALAGARFKERWAGRPLSDLHTLVSEQMPLTAPGSLSDENYTDVVAYLLARNGVEAGEVELDPAAEGVLDLVIDFGE